MTNRWAIALAGVVVMMCLGTVYSWSLFTQPLIASFGWNSQTTAITFELAIFFLGVGAVIGGRWQDTVGPRRVIMTGVALWGIGLLLAGLGTSHFGSWWIWLTYGVIGGLGLGMGYITPVAVVTKWFPDMRGVGSGMVVMGFGLGAFVFNQIVPRLPAFAAAAKQAGAYAKARTDAIAAHTTFDPTQYAMTAENVQAIMTTFVVSGVVFLVIGLLCAWFVNNPPAGYTVPGAIAAAASAARSFSPGEMFGTIQFYLLWLMLFLNVTAGIMVISVAVPAFSELTGVTPKEAGVIYGFLAVFNGLGRFFWGSVSDRIGRNAAYFLIFGIQAVIFYLLGGFHSVFLVGVAFAIILLCYGGGFGTMPSFNADYFGTKFLGVNYGWILTAWGVAGVVGPLIAARVKDFSGSYVGAFTPIAIMLTVAAILPLITRKPKTAAAPAVQPA